MSRIILMAESGSDITPEQAKQNGIVIVPMHVSFGGETRDDGAFPTTEMFDFYKKHRELPRTSGCTPHDFEAVFERLDREYPDASILYLAYSARLTCSMQSALIAGEGRERFVAIYRAAVGRRRSWDHGALSARTPGASPVAAVFVETSSAKPWVIPLI
ncbi:MAG: DegV family protein [Christensenellales bacterium]